MAICTSGDPVSDGWAWKELMISVFLSLVSAICLLVPMIRVARSESGGRHSNTGPGGCKEPGRPRTLASKHDVRTDHGARLGGGGELHLPDADEPTLGSLQPAAPRGQGRPGGRDLTQAAGTSVPDGVDARRGQNQGGDAQGDLVHRGGASRRLETERSDFIRGQRPLHRERSGGRPAQRVQVSAATQDLAEVVRERPEVGPGGNLGLEGN